MKDHLHYDTKLIPRPLFQNNLDNSVPGSSKISNDICFFTYNCRKHAAQPPGELPDIRRVDILKIVGVTVSSSMTVAEHIDHMLCSRTQTVYDLTLTAHAMNAKCLNNVFIAIILAKLTARAHGLDSLVHPKYTESKHSYVDASVPDFAPRILLHLQSYVTLQTRDFLPVLWATLPTLCINY